MNQTASDLRSMRRLVILLLLLSSATASPADEGAAAKLYEQGLQAFNEGEVREAVIHLKNALQQDPTILPAHILLGNAYVAEGSGGAAERELEIALKLGADRSLVLPVPAKAYLLQRSYSHPA